MKRPVWILHLFVVGLALHNVVMAELWAAGIRGSLLDLVSAWKEALLGLGILIELHARRSLRFRPVAVDWLALAYGGFVLLYAVIPQHVLEGQASTRGIVLGLRHDLLPVVAYLFGRGLQLTLRDVRRLGATLLGAAAGVAAFGLVDVYAIPLSWWRSSGAPGWFSEQLGFAYQGLSGLPENFLYNTGDEHPLRRVVSTFLSPLATSYMLVVALLLAAVWRLRLRAPLRIWLPTSALIYAGLLFTHSRSSYLALTVGLVVVAAVRPHWRRSLLLGAVVVSVCGFAFDAIYPQIGPTTTYTAFELACQEAHAHQPSGTPMTGCGYREAQRGIVPRTPAPGTVAALPGKTLATAGITDASTESHWQSFRDGISTVFAHPQGYGLGNAGSTAARTGAPIKAGESTYSEIAVDTGLIGGLLFVAWSLLLLVRVAPCAGWLGGALAAVLALGLQTDVIGVPWLVLVVWPLAGWQVGRPEL